MFTYLWFRSQRSWFHWQFSRWSIAIYLYYASFPFVCVFSSLQCDRLRIHKNFMVSLVFLYVVTVLYFEPYIHDMGDPGDEVCTACKLNYNKFTFMSQFASRKIPWYKQDPRLCNIMLSLLMFCFQVRSLSYSQSHNFYRNFRPLCSGCSLRESTFSRECLVTSSARRQPHFIFTTQLAGVCFKQWLNMWTITQ